MLAAAAGVSAAALASVTLIRRHESTTPTARPATPGSVSAATPDTSSASATQHPDGRRPRAGFIAADGARLIRDGATFRPYGFNDTARGIGAGTYFANPTETQFARVREDLIGAKRLGANSVRIFLELHDFVERSPDGTVHARTDRIRAYGRVLREAERLGIALDVTGNLAWKPGTTPPWYDALDNEARWDVQATFWTAVARESADSPAVLCYELTSEPAISADPHAAWYTGRFGDYDFLQVIARGVPEAQQADTARAWTRTLREAIEREDPDHLVGIGLLPFATGPVSPTTLADELDLLVLHDYPVGTADDPHAIDPHVATARAFASHGIPVLLGETAAVHSDVATERRYLRAVAPVVAGTMSFYDGRNPRTMRVETIPDAMYRDNLRAYLALRDELGA